MLGVDFSGDPSAVASEVVGVLEMKILRLIELLEETERERGNIDCMIPYGENYQDVTGVRAIPHPHVNAGATVGVIEGE